MEVDPEDQEEMEIDLEETEVDLEEMEIDPEEMEIDPEDQEEMEADQDPEILVQVEDQLINLLKQEQENLK